ncbi:acetyl-CoA carboxylase biotin carboxyl carrier protein [Yinghuangia sp. YIM S09857]|uniref:acetyl-CoA carboxylase biotin carboxyl carrier protein n=1 Tax=Yinghuangia sp. YIM S09857 TaxID=3436929 RepID=UPI003F533A5E
MTVHNETPHGLAEEAQPSPRRLRLETAGTVIQIDWVADAGPALRVETAPIAGAAGKADSAAPVAVSPGSPAASGESPDAAALFVRAPMVGTFYHAPDAGARPFVGIGDVVQPGQTIGILEVMKMMNPITADVAGRVVEMVVSDAEPVEYDQPLIALEPLGSG